MESRSPGRESGMTPYGLTGKHNNTIKNKKTFVGICCKCLKNICVVFLC